MKALEYLKREREIKKHCADVAWGYYDKGIDEAIKELEEYESDMDSYLDYTTGSRCTKSFNSCLGSIKIAYEKELEKIVKENSEDRLAELEKVILDYYLAEGYIFGLFGSKFQVNISTFHNEKEIKIMFKKDFNSRYETVFRAVQKTTKKMFDAAFEHFSIKDRR